MPSKSQRAASRQAKMRKNKKGGKIASRVFNSAPSSDISQNSLDPSIDTPVSSSSTNEKIVSGSSSNSPQASTVESTSPVYPHLPRELRRILVLAVIMFGILGISYFIFIN